MISATIGADAVVPAPPDRLGALRLARLKLAARNRLEIRGRPRIERGVRVTIAPRARVVLEDGCLLGEGCRIEAAGGTIRIGPHARIGARALLVALAGIEIGAGCTVGEWSVSPTTSRRTRTPSARPGCSRCTPSQVRVGDGARIGAHAALLAGATVTPGEVVGSYVTRAARG